MNLVLSSQLLGNLTITTTSPMVAREVLATRRFEVLGEQDNRKESVLECL